MSKTIDERVVSMKFDNKHFESNVKTTMSTLDKLKQSLNLSGASKGLENVGAAAKNVSFNPLANGIETVKTKFSALEVMGVTALANITNSAVNAGKRIVSSLTIDPIKTGFQEYELKMGSIQTIMASTGESLETVNKYLEELNLYSDQTIYSFSDMTQNIGKFTNAGVKLPDAVAAIKGIANAAALSGANANEASRSMYNFAQALSAGYVKLIDWKSIELANMATVEFKEQLIATAVEVGTLTKTADGMYETLEGTTISATKNFNDSLQDQWMTTEVLTKTLADYADETTDIGERATAAATEVKTFSMMMDTLKESAQSGWAQTWENIFGDFNQGKSLWTSLSNTFGDIISKSANARNELLSGALGSSGSKWDTWIDKVNKAGISTNDFKNKLIEVAREHNINLDEMIEKEGSLEKALTKVSDAKKLVVETLKRFIGFGDDGTGTIKDMSAVLEKFQGVVDKTIGGEFGNGADRVKNLTEAGENYAVVQKLVNRVWERNGKTWEDCTITSKDLAAAMSEMSDAELESIGFTKEQIKTIRELSGEMENMSTEEFMEALSKPTGRELLLDSFKNIGEAIKKVFSGIKKAWEEVFPPKSMEEKQEGLYNIIEAIHAFTEKLVPGSKTVENLTSTFKGLFAIIDIIRMVVGGGLSIAFKVIKAILNLFGLDILDVTAYIGEAIYSFRNWLTSGDKLGDGIKKVAGALAKGAKKVKEWFDSFINMPAIQDAISWFADKLKGLKDVGVNSIKGLINGLKSGVSTVWEVLKNIGKKMLEVIKKVLGIHSPSKEFEKVGSFSIEGIIVGIKNKLSKLWSTLKGIGVKMVEIFKSIDWNKIFAVGISIAIVAIIYKIAKAFTSIANAVEGFGNILDGAGDVLQSTSKAITRLSKAASAKLKSEALKNMAVAILILAGALIALSFIDGKDLLKAGVAIVVLAGVLFALAIATEKMNKASATIDKNGVNVKGLTNSLAGIGIALLLMAFTAKLIGSMDPDEAKQGFIGLAAMVLALGVVLIAFGTILKGGGGANMDKAGKMLRKMATTLLLMVVVCKLVAGLSMSEIKKGIKFALYFSVFAGLLVLFTKIAGNNVDKAGKMISKITFAMLLMVGVVKLAAMLDYDEMQKGAIFAAGFAVFVGALVLVSKTGKDQQIGKIGGTIMAISFALLMMVGVCKLISLLSLEEMSKGGIFVAGFVALIAALLLVTRLGGENKVEGAAKTITAMAGAIAIMAAIAIILGIINTEYLVKGILAVTLLSAMMALMIHATKGAQDCQKNLIMMTVVIALLAGAVVGLSFLDPAGLARATVALIVVMLAFALIVSSVSKLDGAKGMIKPLIMITIITALLAGAVVGLSFINAKKALPNTIALAALLLSFSTSIAILGKAGKISKTAKDALLPMLGVVLGLAIILGVMSALNVEASMVTALALGVLVNLMATAMFIIANAGGVSKTAKDALLPMTAVIAGLAIILGIMSALNVEASMGTALALGVLLNLMATAMFIIGQAGGVTKTARETLLPLTAVVAGLAIILGILAALNVEPSINAAISLGVLLNAMATAVLILSYAGTVSKSAQESMLVLTAVVAGLAIIMGILAALNVEPSINAAIALGILLNAMAAACLILDSVGTISNSAYIAMGVMTLIVAGLAAILGALDAMDVSPSIETAGALAVLLTGMSTACLIVSKIPASGGITGATALATFVGIMAVVLAALGALSLIPGVNEIVESGGELLSIIGYAIGSFIGSLIGGFGAGMSSGLPEIGTNLSEFMENGQYFFDNASKIDGSLLAGVTQLTAAISLLIASQFLEGLVGLIDTAPSLGELGTDLSEFMDNAGGFIAGACELKPEMLDGVKALADALLVLTAANLLDGIANLIGGGSLEDFGTQVGHLGTGLNSFAASVGDFGEDKIPTVEAAAKAVKTLAEAASTIPNAGGALALFVGDNELGDFADQFPKLGTGIRGFLDNIGEFTDAEVATIGAGADAVKTLASAANEIPNSGGFVGLIVGNNDLDTFAEMFPAAGTGLSGFAKNIGTFSDSQCKTVEAGAKAIGVLADIADEIPNSGAWWEVFTGSNDLDDFAGQFPAAGKGIKGFADSIGTFSGDKLASFKAGVSALESLTTLSNLSLKDVKNTMKELASGITDLGDNVSNFVNTVPDGTNAKVTSVKTTLTNIVLAINDLASINQNAAYTFKTAVNKLSDAGIKQFISAFTNVGMVSKIKNTGTVAVNNFVAGVESKQDSAKAAIGDVATKAASGAGSKTVISSMTSAGVNLGEGLVSGINSMKQAAYDAGFALGQKAVQGEKDGQASNSPSKLTIQSGKWLGEGLVIGIKRMGNSVYSAGKNMGETATNSISNAISKVSDIVSGDMDTQPTIRPVLDLDDVTAGVSRMNGLFNSSQSVGVLANVGTISSMMNKNQNGKNGDVISAIDSLRKDLGNSTNNTYNINGVTYDDGSNVSEAVGALVRAVRVERRR